MYNLALVSWVLLYVEAGVLWASNSQAPFKACFDLDGANSTNLGVGFDLTSSYGTAAISLADDTFVTVAKIPAKNGYTEIFERLSLDSSRHLSPPYQNPGDSLKDAPRQTLRKARKAMGLPASEDVGHLADMLIALRSEVEKELHFGIRSASITTLNLAALYQEDLHDAAEYAGFESLDFPLRYDILYETSASYAGYGYGLCKVYEDKEGCKKEQTEMDSEVIMAASFTQSALTVTLSVMKSAYYLYEPDHRHLSNFTLGFGSGLRRKDEKRYWKAVETHLAKIMLENPYYERPGKVLLTGECSKNQTFQHTLQKVLADQMDKPPAVINKDSEFAAAKGAAEFAKRLPWNPY